MFRLPFNPAPAKQVTLEEIAAHEKEMAETRLLNLRDRHPEMFTTRLGKNMPKNRRGAGMRDMAGLSRKQVITVRSSILLRHV